MKWSSIDMEPSGTEMTHPQRGPAYVFFIANSISALGSRLTFLAIPWFVLQTTGSVTRMGVTAFVSTVPLVISAFLGSTLIDRFGFKRASIISDIISGFSVSMIPLLSETIGLAFWQLLILVFLGGLFKVPGQTARSSLLPDLAEKARMYPERANAIADGVNQIASFLGAPLAALLIVWIGTKNLLWLDAVSFCFSAILIGRGVPVLPVAAVPIAEKTPYLHQLREGVHFILRDSVLLAITITVMITNLLDQALGAVVAPAYIQHVFHSPLPLGWIGGSFAGAALVGTLLFGMIGHRLPRRQTFACAFILNGVARYWILLVPLLPLMIVVYAIAGFGLAPLNPLIDTVLQERVPKEMRARVFGTTMAGSFLGIPLGAVMGVCLVNWMGLQATLLVLGALYLGTTLSLLVNPALKNMEK